MQPEEKRRSATDGTRDHHLVAWVDIPVAKLDRAIAFYSALLAAPVERQAGSGFVVGMLPASPGAVGARLVRDPAISMGAATPPAAGGAPPLAGPLVYLAVPGRLREAVRAVGALGGQVLAPPHSLGEFGWRAIVLDSEGNRIALHAPTDA
jgi:predicted enzyme related to lactoylglutathione lyase